MTDLRVVGRRPRGRARSIGATPIRYPKPPGEEESVVEAGGSRSAAGSGIVAREDDRGGLAGRRGAVPRATARARSRTDGDEGLRLAVAPASSPAPSADSGEASRTRTGSVRSRTTRRSARTWSAATTASARRSAYVPRAGIRGVRARHPAVGRGARATSAAAFDAADGGLRVTAPPAGSRRAARRAGAGADRARARRRDADLRRAGGREQPARAALVAAGCGRATGSACSRRRRPTTIVAMIAVLKAGGAYVPRRHREPDRAHGAHRRRRGARRAAGCDAAARPSTAVEELRTTVGGEWTVGYVGRRHPGARRASTSRPDDLASPPPSRSSAATDPRPRAPPLHLRLDRAIRRA